MEIKKLLVLLFLVVSCYHSFAQSRRVADRYFDEFSYVRSAKLYESIYKKGDSSSYILKKLGDSYYNNAEIYKAEYWYEKLTKSNDTIPDNYLFKYAQVLRSNGKYQKSDSLFIIIDAKKGINTKKEELANQNYLVDFNSNKNKKISFRNLALNTPYSDFGGVILNEKETFFASASPVSSKKEMLYKWNNQPFLNIYKANNHIIPLEESNKDSVLILNSKKLLRGPINTRYHESTPIFTKDGKTMYFTRVNYDGKKLSKDKKKVIHLKLYKSIKKAGVWVKTEELPFNSDEYSIGHPALSPDEKTLYFISDMPGGIGETDIYKVAITEKGYGSTINLGNTINTSAKEMFPFIGADSTLYFSSNGHIGVGLLDVFQTKIKENGTYSKPLNLGYPFNSNKDDFSFYVDAKGKKGFISSNREKGKGDDDIYSFIITEQKKPVIIKPEICTQIITGIVRSKHDNSLIPNATVKLINKERVVVAEVLSDEKGVYTFDKIPCIASEFSLNGIKLDYKPDKNNKIVTGIEKGTVTKKDLVLTPLIIGDQIVISPIYFNFNKATIREDAQYELENIVIVMNNHPNMIIKIESHTDSRGGKEYNRKLSDRRSKSTRDYIVSRGIALKRIASAIGYGEANLLNDCNDVNRNKCTEEEHQLNRRSYFYIVKGGDGVGVENKKPTVIDKTLLLKKQKLQKEKFLLERLNNFRQSRSRQKKSNKCKRDTDCN